MFRTTLIMDRSYQCHTCLREFSGSDSLRRLLESGIFKQNEDNQQSEEAPSKNSDSQQNVDDSCSSEEDELRQSQSKMTKSESWDRIMGKGNNTLQDTFDKTCETYLEQNTGMKIAEAEKRAFDEFDDRH